MTESFVEMYGAICPLPLNHEDQIVIGHGSGGKMTQQLIEKVFLPYLASPALQAGNDFASLSLPSEAGLIGRLAVSTDSHVVKPLFFPGGDIGRLAICGTVNDLAMSGALPLYLTVGFILEEGLPIETLEKVLVSMYKASSEAGVHIAAGDTKVVEKGKADGLFINTAGVGWIPANRSIGGELARPGDVVIVSGTLGDHGIAVLAARGDLGFQTNVESDTAPLNHMIQAVLKKAPGVHVLRDPTRGGLATSLNEIARQSGVAIVLDEDVIPVNPPVRAACELLGFDPLYVANEGKVIVILPEQDTDLALTALRKFAEGEKAVVIGRIESAPAGLVLMKTGIGGTRLLDMLAGEMLPRIC